MYCCHNLLICLQVLANISGAPPSPEEVTRLQRLLALDAMLAMAEHPPVTSVNDNAPMTSAANNNSASAQLPFKSRPDASGDETDSSMPTLESSTTAAPPSAPASDCEMPSLPVVMAPGSVTSAHDASFASLDSSTHDDSGYLALLQQPHSPVSDTKVGHLRHIST